MTRFYRFLLSCARGISAMLFRFRVEGSEHIPEHTPFVLCCNHLSFFDPIFLMLAFSTTPVCFLAKESLFHKPVLGWALRKLKAIPVNRGGKGNISAVRQGSAVLGENCILGIFPEGTRSKDGKLHPGKSGAVLIANLHSCDVMPCAIVTKKGRVRPFRQVTLRLGAAIPFGEIAAPTHAAAQLREGTRLIMSRIAGLLEESSCR